MKKSELASGIDTKRMSQTLQCYEYPLKLAITSQNKQVETASIDRITTITEARKLFGQAKSEYRKALIAIKWFSICVSIQELQDTLDLIGGPGGIGNNAYEEYYVSAAYTTSLRAVMETELKTMKWVEQVFELWSHGMCGDEGSPEDKQLFDRMCQLADEGKIQDPVFFIVNNNDEMGSEYQKCTLIAKIVAHMTPDQALEALKQISNVDEIDGTQDNFHRYLIAKAAPLFKR